MVVRNFICEHCETVFAKDAPPSRVYKYCSPECTSQFQKTRKRKRTRITKFCETCGKQFETFPNQVKKGKGRFCSKTCSKTGKNNIFWSGGPIPVVCTFCDKEFEIIKSQFICSNTKQFFCSQGCFHDWLRIDPSNVPAFKNGGGSYWECNNCGKQFWHQGKTERRFCCHKCCTDYYSGEQNPNWSKKISQCEWCETEFEHHPSVKRRFCSHECHEAYQQEDPANNPTWKGGVTPELELARARMVYKHWQKAVFERDNWECKICGKHGGGLHAHHLYSFREFPHLRYSIPNGHTLCKSCHMKLNRHEDDYLRSVGLDPQKPPLFF